MIEKGEIIEIPVENPTNFSEKEESLLYLFGGVLLVLLFLAALSSNVYYRKKNKEKRLENKQVKAEKIENDLETIINLIGGLQAFDTENIEPLYNPLEQKAFKHEDIENSDNKKDEFLKNAAASNDDYFLVPRVVE